jgi:hypothetical protein
MGRPTLFKKGPMSAAERQRRRRRKLARVKAAENPKAMRRAERERRWADKILALPDRRYGII